MSSQPHTAQQANNICERSIVYLEARGESVKGVAAVRRVIRNRARNSGKSRCSVVKKRHQFSSYKRGMKLSKVKISKDFLTKWEDSNKMPNVLGKEYEFFYSGESPKWADRMVCDRVVGKHTFCKLKREG